MKISVIGTGRVGSAVAFALVVRRLCDELVLVGRTPESGAGDAADLTHASVFEQKMVIRTGAIHDVSGSDVVVVTAAGAKADKPDRMLGMKANAELMADLAPRLARACPGAVYLMVTNPVDLMTQLFLRHSGLPTSRVFGTGTLIDTARYRAYLSEHAGIHTHDIRAYILGEHGDTQFPALSTASAAGEKLDPSRDPMLLKFADDTREAGYAVHRAKGYTNYAIAAAAAFLADAIAKDSRAVFPVSTMLEDYHGVSGVCLSVPAVVGRAGITKVLKVDLSGDEIALLNKSATAARSALAAVGG